MALLAYLLILTVKTIGAWRYIHGFPRPSNTPSAVSVAICQPILSGDPALEATLEDNLAALPEAHFLWIIDVDDGEATRITHRLVTRHPSQHIDVMTLPQPADGINPKLYKLEAARALISSSIVLVLDDDTRLSQRSLQVLLESLSRSELSTGLPFYRRASNLYGNLLAQFVNNNSALAYLPLLSVAPPVSINGMCYAMSADTLQSLGGFTTLLEHLTDDLAVADGIRALGGRIIQTPYPQDVATTIGSLTGYVTQMHRWYVFALLLMRRRGVVLNSLMVVMYGLPPILLTLGIVAACAHPSRTALGLLVATLLGRLAVLLTLQKHLTGGYRHRPLLSIASEMLQPLHLLHAILVKTIRWRTRHYRVYDNDHFVSL